MSPVESAPAPAAAPKSGPPQQLTCVLGLDFGNSKSKMSLAYTPSAGQCPVLIRVPFSGSMEDPERPDTTCQQDSAFDFVAFAALDNNELVVGRQSLTRDCVIPLKTILLHYSGAANQDTIKGLPGGRELCRLWHQGLVTRVMEEEVLLKHFRLLYKHASIKAEALHGGARSIVEVVLTYPNHLYPKEGADAFQIYADSYVWLMRLVVGLRVVVRLVSEGQGTALYLSELFHDPQSSFNRDLFWADVKEIDQGNGLCLVTPDSGSSSLNIQTQVVFFGEDGQLCNSYSLAREDWLTGVQGGSHMANEAVRDLITGSLGPHVAPGEIASLVSDFERKKCQYDWASPDRAGALLLHSSDSEHGTSFPLLSSVLRNIFDKAFSKGLHVLVQEIRHVIQLRRDFAVVLCGGSYYNKGLRTKVAQMMAEARAEAQGIGINMKCLFLAEYDMNWSSAVSAGAALSVMRVPLPTTLLSGSAIGLQVSHGMQVGGPAWVGEDAAGVLLVKGCKKLPDRVLWNGPTEKLRFGLVCDPAYYSAEDAKTLGPQVLKGVRRRQGHKEDFVPIDIKDSRGRLVPYDLGFWLSADCLPSCWLRFVLSGADATMLAGDINATSASRSLLLLLTIHRVDRRGRRLRNELDQRWLLEVATDSVTKLLYVSGAKPIPVWCAACRKEICAVAYKCKVCPTFYICMECCIDESFKGRHGGKHGWKCVRTDVLVDSEE